MVFLHYPVSSLLFNSKYESSTLLLCFLCLFLALVEPILESIALTFDLLLILSYATISLILKFLELQGEFLFVLLLLCEALFQGTDLLITVLSGTSKSLSHGLKFLLKSFNLILRLNAESLVRLHNLLDLILVLAFHCLDDCV